MSDHADISLHRILHLHLFSSRMYIPNLYSYIVKHHMTNVNRCFPLSLLFFHTFLSKSVPKETLS